MVLTGAAWLLVFCRRNLFHSPLLDFEFGSTPLHTIRSESGEPDREVDGVAQWNKPKLLRQHSIFYPPNAYGPSHEQTQDQVRAQKCRAKPGRRRCERCRDRQRQTMCEDEAEKGRRPHYPHRAGPTDLVFPKATKRPRRIHRPNAFLREQHFAAGFVDAVANLVIVGQ